VSGWTIFTICFTTLLVGTWSAFTVFEFYRASKRVREAEVKARAARATSRGRGL
jgi:hypothetical protein